MRSAGPLQAEIAANQRRAIRVAAVRRMLLVLFLAQTTAITGYAVLQWPLTPAEWRLVGVTLAYPLGAIGALGVGVDLLWIGLTTMAVGCLATAAFCLITGGLQSPFLIVFATTSSSAFALGGPRSVVLMIATSGAAMLLVATVQLTGHLPPSVLHPGGAPAVALLMATYAIALLGMTTLSAEQSRERWKRGLRRARDRAEEASRVKSSFLAMMSHELRTPMTGVIGMVDLLRTTRLSDEQAGFVGTLRASADALLVVLNDILDLSKIEAGHLSIEHLAFDPATIVTGVADLFTPAAAARSLVVEAQVAPAVPRRLVGDPTRIRQVVANLVGNAVKFTPAGRIDIVARYDEPPAEQADGSAGGQLVIEVRDTGIGISEQERERLFEPFRQADESTARRFGGTGLGLAICKRLCEAMEGSIEVESEPGRGSVFRCTFAVTEPRPASDASEPSLAPAAPEARGLLSDVVAPDASQARPRLRILVAEDTVVSQMVIKKALERLGHDVTVVDNGALAFEAVQTTTFDLVLMDMQMPVMDGTEATRAIRRLETGSARLPIYALSADVIVEHQESHLAAGLDGFLRKPIEWPRVKEVLAGIPRRDCSPGLEALAPAASARAGA